MPALIPFLVSQEEEVASENEQIIEQLSRAGCDNNSKKGMMQASLPASESETMSKLRSDLAKCLARKAQHITDAELATTPEGKAFHLVSATQVEDEIEEIQDVLRAMSVSGKKVA